MCGIAGIVDFESHGVITERVRAVTGRLAHRGPDEEGYHFDACVGLGHRRLSIIDVEGGKQPMSNEDGTLWLVYNGEIYNYVRLREELKGMGYAFRTRSDTEVLLKAYECWGAECLERLNGMFAFAIWNSVKKCLFMARDRLGIKPLVYHYSGKRIVFASELRSLLAGMDNRPPVSDFGLVSYLLLQYVPGERTILEGVNRLMPGEAAYFSKDGFKKWKWWTPGEKSRHSDSNPEEVLLEYLSDSVRMRMVSDVPIGAFLSGGIDSSLIVGTIRGQCGGELKTYQVAFEEPEGYDESRWAQLVSGRFDTAHRRFAMNPGELERMLPKIAANMGEPLADPALIPTYIISSVAKNEVSVALTGEGGDELFAGYLRYRLVRYAKAWKYLPGWLVKLGGKIADGFPDADRWRKAIDALNASPGALSHLALVRVMDLPELQALCPDIDVPGIFEEIVSIYEPYYENLEDKGTLRCAIECDLNTWLPCDLLTKVDLMSMAHGLEARVPYLDHRIVEWASGLETSQLINCGEGKLVLKKAARNVLPKEILERRKQGFDVPLDHWFRGPLRSFLADATDLAVRRLNLPENIMEKWVEAELSGARNYGLRLFGLFLLGFWTEGLN